MNPAAIGVDVGGTHLRAALVEARGAIVHVERHRLRAKDPAGLLEQISQDVELLRKRFAGVDELPMGVGFAGQIWRRSGTVAVAPNLGWREVPFGAMLAQRFGRPVRLINDLNAIAVAEAACGAGAGSQELLCVFVGTGVGMGAVANGRVVEGADGLATEIGHIKVASTRDGRLCGCGERGCLEAYTSGHHFPALLAAKVAAGLASPLYQKFRADPSQATAGDIDQAIGQGDAAAIALWDETSDHLARAIGNTVTLFNPATLVLGGGVLEAAPRLKADTTKQIATYAARSAMSHLTIAGTTLGDDAGIIGAALASRV